MGRDVVQAMAAKAEAVISWGTRLGYVCWVVQF
jgi:hypothetical protein